MTYVQYQFNFDRYREHLVDVRLYWQADDDKPMLWLPSWLPGSYLMREFARHITVVTYDVYDGSDVLVAKQDNVVATKHRAIKLSKNQWQLPNVTAGQWVQVHYEVYCYDLSVRTAYVDQRRLFGNFSSLALAVMGQEQQACKVCLHVPMGFIDGLTGLVSDDLADGLGKSKFNKTKTDKRFPNKANAAFTQQREAFKALLACGLSASVCQSTDYQSYELVADSYDELIDYPFEFGLQTHTQFMVTAQDEALTQDKKLTLNKQIWHHVYISGHHHTDMSRLQRDLQRICQCYVNMLGSTPFDEYHFLTHASGHDYGGLEHGNSTALITPRADLPSLTEPDEPSDGYQRFLGLCSHEYFHAWWVKTIRPDVMMAVDLTKEAYTPLLWVFEGFTSYVDDFMLQASGVISTDSYLKLLTEQINRHQQTDGRAWQSVAESSFDAWIKLYRSDENTANAGISYYNKGALVALCLDILLLTQTQGKKRLFDVIKQFYQLAKCEPIGRIGMSMDSLNAVMCEYLPSSVWQAFVDNYVNGVKPLPIKDMLASVGVSMENPHDNPHNKPHGNPHDNPPKHLPWGIHTQSSPTGLVIQKVKRNSVASQAGLSANDVIVAIDGIKASNEQLARVAKQQSQISTLTIRCHAFRGDELICVHVPAQTNTGVSANPPLDTVRLQLRSDSQDGTELQAESQDAMMNVSKDNPSNGAKNQTLPSNLWLKLVNDSVEYPLLD